VNQSWILESYLLASANYFVLSDIFGDPHLISGYGDLAILLLTPFPLYYFAFKYSL
jgi:hypothetical protein